MMPATTRPASTVRKARPWRMIVILALVAACTLLAVPGTAGAHVRAKYRTEYKRQITLFDKAFMTFANNYDNIDGRARGTAPEIMAPMVGDPEPEGDAARARGRRAAASTTRSRTCRCS